MSAQIYQNDAFTDTTPQVYNTTANAFEDAEGKRYENGEWVDAWTNGFPMKVGESYSCEAYKSYKVPYTAICLAIKGSKALMMSNGMYGAAWPGVRTALSLSPFYALQRAVSNAYIPEGGAYYYLAVYDLDGNWSTSYNSTAHGQLVSAANRYQTVGATYAQAWVGTMSGSDSCYVNPSGQYKYVYGTVSGVIAPSFHLDLTKVQLVNGILTAI